MRSAFATESGPLAQVLIEQFDLMPPQLRQAARFVLDRPKDVALMSMREQALAAGVSHTTMMRLARWIQLKGYEDVRALYADAMRLAYLDREAEADNAGRSHKDPLDETVQTAIGSITAQIKSLGAINHRSQFIRAAKALADADNLFTLGFRDEHSVARHFASSVSSFGVRVALLDGNGGNGLDAFCQSGRQDALFVISLAPYSKVATEIARKASSKGLTVIAVTDSNASPLKQFATECIVVLPEARQAFKGISSALAAAEILSTTMAKVLGKNSAGIDIGDVYRENSIDFYFGIS